eukprot:TRINITY_DN7389_c0_g1_i1.p1 TRINITY_DN7389_c0_g1~~TRINITY_DN7389_c0_g1_i1.p1  ORF type:complete len:181 (+),score=42.51 TRINITY_DN7389_c0_g1_i1:519-1061(+)
MRYVAPVRKELGIRTIFNILGPLTNPARPTHMVVGVGTKSLGEIFAQVFARRKIRALVVHAEDGLDEITTSGVTHIWDVSGGSYTKSEITPSMFGLQSHPSTDILGASPAENAETFRRILRGEEKGAVRDFLLLNAGAGLYVVGLVSDFVSGVQLAKRLIEDGTTLKYLEDWIKATKGQD